MDAISLYRAGQLEPAIAALGAELKRSPLEAKRRTMLFELLCFAGQYDRAEKQLDILADASKDALAGAFVYKAALHAERTRQEMFERGTFPASAEPNTEAEPIPGTLNSGNFRVFTDADPRIGAHLEVFIAGSYTWIPLQYVDSLEIAPPTRLRDLLWAPAVLRATPSFRLQDLGEVLLPVLSPLSYKQGDDAVRLGRATVWEPDEQFGEVPYGQKLFVADGVDQPVLEVRTLSFQHHPDGDPAAKGERAATE